MRTKSFLKHLIMCALLLTTSRVVGQTSVVGNVAAGPTDFLGWDNTMPNNNFPLMVRHDLNQPIEWYTNAIQRMRLNGNVTGPIGPTPGFQFPNINRDGFFLISGTANAFTNAGSNAPFTRLHLVDNAVNPNDPVVYAQQHGFRPWQRNGITFTGNSDQSYIGHRYAGNDNTDFVIQWSDNPNGSPWGTDRMKCVFNTEYDPAATRGATTVNGLEAIRLWPRTNFDVNVGIGDFAQPGAGDPTERVDMLDGRLRIRQLPDDPPANYLTKVLVVEDFPLLPNERGVVKWRDISTIIPPPTCEWTMNAASPNHVYTAFGAPDPDCPDDDEAAGIGIDLSSTSPLAKLNLETASFDTGMDLQQSSTGTASSGITLKVSGATASTTGIGIVANQGTDGGADNRGIQITANGSGLTNNNWNYGLRADLSGSSFRTRGVSAFTNGARYTGYAGWFVADDNAQWTSGVAAYGRNGTVRRGVEGHAQGGGTLQIGVNGFASPGPGSWNLFNAQYVGVSGLVQRQGTEGNRLVAVHGRTEEVDQDTWAGYFEGHVHITGDASCTAMAWTSDEVLKTDIQEVTQGLGIIDQLRPTTYHFNTDAYPGMNLPAGNQFGFIAQEVEEVLPDLVGQTTFIGRVDSIGNVLVPDQTVKTLNMSG